MSARNDDNDEDVDRQNTSDDQQQQQESIYRSASPPVPTLKNKDKKQKSNVRRSPLDDTNQEQPLPYSDNDELTQPSTDDQDGQSRQNYRKLPTPRQTGLINNLKKLSVAISCCFCLYRCTTSSKEAAA